MMRKIHFYLQFALTFAVLLLTACSNDTVSTTDKFEKGSTRYTAIIYGQNGGDMESSIEGTMRDIQSVLGDNDKVRVLLVYKYGGSEKFEGTKAYPGQLLKFEITKNTDLSNLKDSSAIVEDSIKLYDPDFMASVLNYAHDSLPADEYLLFVEGHGAGYSFAGDYPKPENEKSKALAKTPDKQVGFFLPDEWVPFAVGGARGMTASELAEGIKKSKISHFKAILFNVCLMANVETLEDIYPYADYLMVSEHSLLSGRGELMTFIVDALTKNVNGNFEDVAKAVFENKDIYVSWQASYYDNEMNGDFQLIKTDKYAVLDSIFKKLSSRLIELYADESKRPAIDRAADKTYKISSEDYLFDARDYADNLAKETEDETLEEIADELGKALDSLSITHKMEARFADDAPPGYFSFSIVLVDSASYNDDMGVLGKTNRDAYELTSFHKKTGWGDWLNTNTHEPTGNPYGQE